MRALLSTYTNNRDNNFNLLRFIAASLVLFTHSFPLALGSGAVEPLSGILGMTMGSIAVDIFFVTSGFLIAGSFFNRKNIIAFIWARILRIYPALIVAILFCVFVVGLFFTENALPDYLSDSQTYKFLKRNMTLFWGVKYHLPGVFAENPYQDVVNGSLWTLPYEVKMYALLALTGSVLISFQKRFNKSILKAFFLIIVVIAIMANIINHFYSFTSVYFIHLFSMFFAGTVFYLYRDKIYLSSVVFFIILIGLLFLLTIACKDLFFILYCVVFPYLVFYLAYVPSGRIRSFNKVGDYSYGIYIYAFPVQQSVAALLPGVSVASMILLSFVFTLMLSFLSWHLIEKKFLKMKGNYVVFEKMISQLYLRITHVQKK